MGQLVTLPLRLTVRTASLFLRGSEEVLKRALALTGRTVEAEPTYSAGATRADEAFEGNGASPTARTETTERDSADAGAAAPPEAEAASAPPPPPPQPQAPSTPLAEEPSHVSEEPEIVEEIAEPGAEEGAGAQITINQPWEGYSKLSAKEVIARLKHSDPAELAAVNLYESANQARQTVLSAVERQLQLANRGGTSN